MTMNVPKLLLAAKKFVSANINLPVAEHSDFLCLLFDTDDFHPIQQVDKLWAVVESKNPSKAKIEKALASVISGYVARAKAFYAVAWNFAPGYVPVKIKSLPAALVKDGATKIYNSLLDKTS